MAKDVKMQMESEFLRVMQKTEPTTELDRLREHLKRINWELHGRRTSIGIYDPEGTLALARQLFDLKEMWKASSLENQKELDELENGK